MEIEVQLFLLYVKTLVKDMLKCKYFFLLIFAPFHIAKTAEWAKIIGLTTTTAITYGILSDQVVARMSPRVFENFNYQFVNNNINDPTKIGLFFGFIGTWHIGLIFGGLLAACSRVGSLPKLSVQDLWVVTPLAFLALGFCSFKDEIERSSQGKSYINNPSILEKERIQAGRKILNSGYIYGSFIGLTLCGYTLYQRITTEK